MRRPFTWSLRWQILAAMLLVLTASLLLHTWITDNLFLSALDRQFTARLSLLARQAVSELPMRRMAAYVSGDEETRIFQQDRERLRQFAHDHQLDRITIESDQGRICLDNTGLLPGAAARFELPAPGNSTPRLTMLHRNKRGEWQKAITLPFHHGGLLRISAGFKMLNVINRIRTRRLLALAAGILLSLGLSWFLVYFLGKRISRLSRAFQSLQSGHGDTRVRLSGRDEIAYLSQAFNEMASELETRAEHERHEQERRLSELKVLSSGVAHEIRNPLAAIGSLADLLVRQDAIKSSSDTRDLMSRLRNEVDRVDKIVAEVLAYARQPALNRTGLDIIELFNEVQSIDPNCRLDMPESLPRPLLDRAGIATVLRNLVLNAREAAGPQGEVILGIRVRPTRLLFFVADNGPGVPAESAKNIFQPFYSNKTRGSGLGLAIARNIIETHGGRVRLAGSARGALFVASLPRLKEA